MSVQTEDRPACACILSEANFHRSRGRATIAAALAVLVGTVLGLVGTNEGAVTVGTPAFTGTGNGAMTLATPAYGAGIQEGTYTARLVEAGANAGHFEVRRPDGTIDGYATVAVAYDGQVKFTIADGGTDFSAAAQFTMAVTIAEATDVGKYKPLNLAATDGAETALAVALYPVGASDTVRDIAVLVRDCEVNGNELAWPDGITADQKTAAIAQLAAVGIIVRL